MRGIVQARLLMKGKTVVITGGTSGIDEVAAEALAQKGARIVLSRGISRARKRLWRGSVDAEPPSLTAFNRRSALALWQRSAALAGGAFLAYLSCRRASIMRLASATISSERLFSRLEGLSRTGRAWRKNSSSPALPYRAYLYAMSLIFDCCHCTPWLIAF